MMVPRILFVHGAAADARLWQPVIAALPADWQAEAITLTYFGEEAWPDDGGGFGTLLHAREVCEMAALMGGDVHVVGWSYSVHVVLQALLDAPALFASALLYEAALGQYVIDDAEREAFNKDAGSVFGAVGAVLAKDGTQAAVRQLVGSAFTALAPSRQAMYLANHRMMPLLMGAGEPPSKIGPDLLAKIETPVLVAMGADTRPAFAIPSRALASALPQGELDVITGADHFLPETCPPLFAAVVEEWIERQAQSGR
ncbi:alpha/beta hydrolase [Croceicoccus ponticola]|uniref:Alpha/beta hydrolase n=1 Tax=Croceicoccus ponticola TaxID=2217664 RepID=A0A437GZL7_9SPHN|nr:alpha/beta hydrolase [Croceicoccus ponticola]RVQ68732.1 alpha/beta hydrolase [Croceicoccus ponticola]